MPEHSSPPARWSGLLVLDGRGLLRGNVLGRELWAEWPAQSALNPEPVALDLTWQSEVCRYN